MLLRDAVADHHDRSPSLKKKSAAGADPALEIARIARHHSMIVRMNRTPLEALVKFKIGDRKTTESRQCMRSPRQVSYTNSLAVILLLRKACIVVARRGQ